MTRWLHAEHRLSKRRACDLCSISSGCYRYQFHRQPEDEIVEVLTRLAQSRRRLGFGLMFASLQLHSHDRNHQRVYRVYKDLALNLRIKPN